MITHRELAKIPTEEAQQAAFFQWVKFATLHGVVYADTMDKQYMQGQGVLDFELIHHIPNGGLRDKVTAMKMINQGVKAGIPDIFFPCAKNGFHGLYIEMKKIGGVLSKDQKKIIEQLKNNGYCVKVCYTFNEARIALLEYYYVGKEIYN